LGGWFGVAVTKTMPPKKALFSASSSPKMDLLGSKANKNRKRDAQRKLANDRAAANSTSVAEITHDDLMAELDDLGKEKPLSDVSDAEEDDSLSDVSTVPDVEDDTSQFPICYQLTIGRVRVENMEASVVRSLFQRILRALPADYSDQEAVLLAFVATKEISFNHMLRELVLGIVDDGAVFEFVVHEITPVLRAVLRATSSDLSRILAKADPWVGLAMKKAYDWTLDPT